MGRVSSATFSADGTRVLVASEAAGVVFDATSGRPVSPPLGISNVGVLTAVFVKGGAAVVTGADDGSARVWSADGNLLHVFPASGTEVTALGVVAGWGDGSSPDPTTAPQKSGT